MEFILHDFNDWQSLLPLTYTRSVADIRIGILTIREKWENHLKVKTSIITQDYLSNLYPTIPKGEKIIICSSVLPTKELTQQILSLTKNTALWKGDLLIAAWCEDSIHDWDYDSFKRIEYAEPINIIHFPWDIFRLNQIALEADFDFLTAGKSSLPISDSNKITGKGKIFLEEGAKCEAAYLNATEGPIYIGKNAEIMEGSMVRGPFAICNDSQLKMGTKIYGATTIGPFCKVGGEITNSVIFGYTNKAHDGFLGNSVIGEWCNLGADSNNSNLKNNYGLVKAWSYDQNDFICTNLQFCGLMMGDHSKCGINTMFNTGTVVGVSANIYGAGFPEKHIPSFSWGGCDGFRTFNFEKALEVMEKVMERRKVKLDPEMQKIMKHLFNESSVLRPQ